MYDSLSEWLRALFANFWSLFSGLLASVMGYFLPVRNILHLLVLFFIIDVAFGYWAAKKLRGEKFSAKIIWKTTMPRMVISIVLILGSFMWDSVYDQNMVATYKVIGWFISGVLFFSILQNGYRVTNWEMLPLIGRLISGKIKDHTGITIGKEDDNESN